MSTVLTATECTCVNWAGHQEVRQCPTHFHLFRGSTRLTSIGRIVAHSFPLDPSIPAATIENARDRGATVDRLFADYVRGNLTTIPAGSRRDAVDLFLKLKGWYDRQHFKTVEVQVLLGGEDHGGVCDFKFDGVTVDLKSTYEVLDSHRMQVAAYDRLGGIINGEAYILHVTERFLEPRKVPLKASDCSDWLLCLDHFRMLKRRGAWKERD